MFDGAISRVTNWWPKKRKGETRKFSLDIAKELISASGSIVACSASCAPSGDGELVISNLNVSGTVLSLTTSGGVPTRVYTIEFFVTIAPNDIELLGADGSQLLGADGATLTFSDDNELLGTDGSQLLGADGAALVFSEPSVTTNIEIYGFAVNQFIFPERGYYVIPYPPSHTFGDSIFWPAVDNILLGADGAQLLGADGNLLTFVSGPSPPVVTSFLLGFGGDRLIGAFGDFLDTQ